MHGPLPDSFVLVRHRFTQFSATRSPPSRSLRCYLEDHTAACWTHVADRAAIGRRTVQVPFRIHDHRRLGFGTVRFPGEVIERRQIARRIHPEDRATAIPWAADWITDAAAAVRCRAVQIASCIQDQN